MTGFQLVQNKTFLGHMYESPNYIYPVHTLPSHLFNIYSRIALASTARCPNLFLSFVCSHHNFLYISLLAHVCQIPSTLIFFNLITRKYSMEEQLMQVFIMQFSSTFSGFLQLSPKYLPYYWFLGHTYSYGLSLV